MGSQFIKYIDLAKQQIKYSNKTIINTKPSNKNKEN